MYSFVYDVYNPLLRRYLQRVSGYATVHQSLGIVRPVNEHPAMWFRPGTCEHHSALIVTGWPSLTDADAEVMAFLQSIDSGVPDSRLCVEDILGRDLKFTMLVD